MLLFRSCFLSDNSRHFIIFNAILCDNNFGDIAVGRSFKHNGHKYFFNYSTKSACAGILFNCLMSNCFESVVLDFKLDIVKLTELFLLLDKGIFRFFKDTDKSIFVEFVKDCYNGQTSDEFGNNAVFNKVLRNDIFVDAFLLLCL